MENTPNGIQIRQITLVELGVIASMLMSAGTVLFTFGVLYGQVDENTQFRQRTEARTTVMGEDIATIKASVAFLTDQAKEDRANGGRGR